jgi:hypothetical protein
MWRKWGKCTVITCSVVYVAGYSVPAVRAATFIVKTTEHVPRSKCLIAFKISGNIKLYALFTLLHGQVISVVAE